MFEAQDVLHKENVPLGKLYYDVAHPTPYGHQLLARGLLNFFEVENLI